MASSRSCLRCACPVDFESADGLCVECHTADSQGSTSVAMKVRARPERADTSEVSPPRTFIGPVIRTRSYDVDSPTVAAPPGQPKAPLPAAPSGYHLLRELGIGGMGTVYLARDVGLNREVAIKFLQRPGNEGAFDRFLVEVRALAQLDHPSILRVHSADLCRSSPFFTTEYAPGGCLAKKLEAEGPLEPAAAARLMATVARAIHAAHSARVIHRDLKPSNILLMADGSPKVSDFGLAKRLDHDDNLTAGSGPLGSPPYMAPEQTGRDEGALDARTDVYGLGATLYHLVTGRRPFLGAVDEVIRQVKCERPTPPRAVRETVPRELEAIILKCMEKNPARRYASAEALAVALDNFVAGSPDINAPLLTPWRRVWQFVERNRRRLAAGAAIVLALLAVAALPNPFAEPPEPQPPQPPAPVFDPEKDIQDALRAGKSVTVVPKVGYPGWLANNWLGNQPMMRESATSGRAMTIESSGMALIAITHDPGVDRYRLSGEFRTVFPKLAPPDNPAPKVFTSCGIFWGHRQATGVEGSEIHAFHRTYLQDYLDPGTRALNVTTGTFQMGSAMVVNTPNEQTITPTWGAGKSPVRFDEYAKLPTDWRKLQIDVTPKCVIMYVEAELGKPVIEAGRFSTEELAVQTRELQKWIGVSRPRSQVWLPEWSPRSPVGIWCRQGAMSIRNLVIEPLPK